MTGVELHAAELVEVGPRRLHELDGPVDVVGEPLVRLVRRVLGEALVPAVHLTQIGEAALGECPDQIDGRGRGVVALEQSRGVGPARALREVEAVDDVAAVRGQRHVAPGLAVARARLGELTRHPPHLHDRHRRAVREHDRHLQHGLDAVADLLGGRAGEGLGAVTALQQKGPTGCRASESLAQVVDLACEDQRRQGRDLGRDRRGSIRVIPDGLLPDGQGPPVVECVELLEHPISLSAQVSAPDARPTSPMEPPQAAGP